MQAASAQHDRCCSEGSRRKTRGCQKCSAQHRRSVPRCGHRRAPGRRRACAERIGPRLAAKRQGPCPEEASLGCFCRSVLNMMPTLLGCRMPDVIWPQQLQPWSWTWVVSYAASQTTFRMNGAEPFSSLSMW